MTNISLSSIKNEKIKDEIAQALCSIADIGNDVRWIVKKEMDGIVERYKEIDLKKSKYNPYSSAIESPRDLFGKAEFFYFHKN